MVTFFIIIVTVIFIAGISHHVIKNEKSEKSIDLTETLLPEIDIHEEIAKTAEAIKLQDPVVIETPFVESKVKVKSKKKTTKKKTPVKKSNKK